jgi:hypothetical protein
MRNSWKLAGVMLVCAAALPAQDESLPKSSIFVNLPANSPVAVLSMNYDQSRTTMRGAAMVIDLHMMLTLRNASPGNIRGVTLRVVSQEGAMGGKGSVTVPSLNVAQGDVFPVRIDMQLMRPMQMASAGKLVQVDLDGVLFNDLSFFGPDRLNSRRYMTACELEAQRDREHFKRVLAQNGAEGLRKEILASIARQGELHPLNARVKPGVAVSAAAGTQERQEQFALLRFPDAPVEPVTGTTQITGNEARAPRIEVRNKSGKPVRFVEMGWLVSDQAGRQYSAGSLPSDGNLGLDAGKTAEVQQENAISFSLNGQPVAIRKVTGYVSQVEFTDGKVWVPTRQSLADPLLQKAVPPSVEEQRLTSIYNNKGLNALLEELKKF